MTVEDLICLKSSLNFVNWQLSEQFHLKKNQTQTDFAVGYSYLLILTMVPLVVIDFFAAEPGGKR